MKTMIIGLGPDYNYPGDFHQWKLDNTRYASNHGASLISRALIKQLAADYVDDFSDIDNLNRTYDACVIAFATHVTSWRDVSEYTSVIEKLKMPVHAFSLGIQDYSGSSTSVNNLHPSMVRLLEIVSDRSKYMTYTLCKYVYRFLSLSLSVYIYIYMYVCACIYIHRVT